jgi:hypothetical protein
VGNRVWPGDLWGVDSDGRLIIVEAKTCKPGTRVDPFVDFVEAGSTVAAGTSPEIEAPALRKHWRMLLEQERNFIRDHRATLRDGVPLNGRYPGVVPYSRHRASVQRWSSLYLKYLAPQLAGSGYEMRVEECLKARERQPNRRPLVVGLLALVNGGAAPLSGAGRGNLVRLREIVGRDEVRLVSIQAGLSGDSVQITSNGVSYEGG